MLIMIILHILSNDSQNSPMLTTKKSTYTRSRLLKIKHLFFFFSICARRSKLHENTLTKFEKEIFIKNL